LEVNVNRSWTLVVGAVLWGCATVQTGKHDAGSSSPVGQVAASSGNRLVCRKEVVIGSHRRQRVCRDEAARNRQRESTQHNLRRAADKGPDPEAPVM
jgi:hypothetical protein